MEAKKSDGILPGFGRNVVSTVKYNGGIIIGLLIICLLLSVMTDSFCTVRNLSNIMRQISINVILACGMTMVIILGGIDLSVGSVIAVSGCLCCGLITNVGVPSIIAIPISICAGTLVGVFNGFVISRTTIPPFIVTLAMMNIGRGFARIYTKATTILVDDPLFTFIGSGKILGGVPIQFVYMLVASMLMSTPSRYTKSRFSALIPQLSSTMASMVEITHMTAIFAHAFTKSRTQSQLYNITPFTLPLPAFALKWPGQGSWAGSLPCPLPAPQTEPRSWGCAPGRRTV